MSDLVKMLLDNDDGSTKKALDLYNKAMRRLQKKSKSKRGTVIIGADEASEVLEKWFTRELEKINLIDADQYQKVKSAIEEWRPRLKPKEQNLLQACGLIQNVFLALLPQVRKKQQLDAVCHEYKLHLQQIIEQEEKQLGIDKGVLQSMPESVQGRISDVTQPVIPLPKSVEKVMQKYYAVTAMQKTFQTPKPVYQQLQDFDNAFGKHKITIEQNRDSAAVVFLKRVATVLSVGLAVMLGIWRTKGEGVTNQIKTVISQIPDR